MGRKIPAKKHRGVKDPAKQQARRFESIKDKINAPPADPDEQPVPRSLLRLFAFWQPRAPAAPAAPAAPPGTKPKRPRAERAGGGDAVAALRRLPGEAGRAFSRRITGAVRALSHPAHQDYPLDLEETDTRGEYIAAQRERRQRKHRAALAARARAAGEGGGEGGGAGGGPQRGERPRKAQRRALRKKEQLKAKEEEAGAARARAARELRYERVAFGDVAHAPPALPPPRRAPHAAGASRPGRRDLLLSSLLPGGGGAGGGVGAGAGGGAGGGDALQRERRERARLAAVEAYRALKKQRARAQGNRA